MVEIEPEDCKFKHEAICCSACGVVVGVTPFHNTAELFKLLAKKLNVTLEI